MMKVCVVGLGYVGLPLALLAAEKGNQVFGFDINNQKIEMLKNGKSPFNDEYIIKEVEKHSSKINFSENANIIKNAEIVLICVPTPIDDNNLPNLDPLKGACRTVLENLQQRQLVIVESTIYPGTMEEEVLPIFTKQSKTVGVDFCLAHCPERIDPGNYTYTIRSIPRVVGGVTKECTRRAKEFYDNLVEAKVTTLSSIKAVETTKVVENTFRDVNIALVNELAKSFDVMGIDIIEVINGASTKPFAFMPHFPGCGVGGHCIPVDPYYLINRSRQNGYDPRFLSMARLINNEMPIYTIQKAADALADLGKEFKESNVTILGLSYKAGLDDTRESPALVMAEHLKIRGANYDLYDPYILEKSTVNNLSDALRDKDCVIIATNHKEFVNINAKQLKEHNVKIVIDGRNCLNKEEILAAGIIYKGIGR